jgi:hypothetical protein
MNSDRTDLTIIAASAVLAILAIAMPVINVGQPIQFIAALGGILLGPGCLAYRLATGSRWGECLMVGLAANVAALMMLALVSVSLHLWHPKIELVIPATTCVLAIVLYRRRNQNHYQTNNSQQYMR